MSNSSGESVHLLVFPYPAQGHMIPLLDLTQHLLNRGLTITILVTPKNLSLLNPLLSKNPLLQTLVLPFPNHPSIPSGIENLKDLPATYFRSMIYALGKLYNPLLLWFKSHPSPPLFILSDFFTGWTHRLATELGIRRIVFSPSGAATLAICNCLWRDLPKRDDPNLPISFPTVPNSPIYLLRQLFRMYRSHVEGDPESEFIRDSFLCNIASWGIVFNSFTELESVYLDHMKKDLGHERVWAVGPLLPPKDDPSGQIDRGGSIFAGAGDVISWLDTCENRSVVYACLGSQTVLNKKQMEEVATGLELSQVRFIWCVKEATVGHVGGEYGLVPDGFEDRVAGRGLVIKGWVPQVMILNHRAVGAFMTHCGWNSVLESVVAGVPMLVWPMRADQFMNARLLVEELKVAVKVCEGNETVPNGEDLGGALAKMIGGSGPLNRGRICTKSKMRVRATELRYVAIDATKEGGSSFKDLEGLVRDFCNSIN